MNHTLKITIVVILLVVVIFVVVHPLVDLEPTVLRHLQASVLLILAVVLARTLAAHRLAPCSRYFATDYSASLRKDSLSRIDLTCNRLC